MVVGVGWEDDFLYGCALVSYKEDKYNYLLILLMQERERQYIRSPYLSTFKTKDSTFFPKIHPSKTPTRNQFISKSTGKKNYHEQIFKQVDHNIQTQRFTQIDTQKIINSKQYRELEEELKQMQKHFMQEMTEIQQKKQQIESRLKLDQGKIYKSKYSLWELKNQIMELENLLKQEQNQLGRFEDSMGYQQDEGNNLQNNQ